MGRADAVMPWFERYRHSLAPRRARVARLTDESWRAALGDQRRTEDWFEFFRNELEEHPWQSVLDTWAARLAPGLMAAATHGVIRTGHATRALALEDTPRDVANWPTDSHTGPPTTAASRRAPHAGSREAVEMRSLASDDSARDSPRQLRRVHRRARATRFLSRRSRIRSTRSIPPATRPHSFPT